jgi:hypothetical protein
VAALAPPRGYERGADRGGQPEADIDPVPEIYPAVGLIAA